jgi:hypothetical protein
LSRAPRHSVVRTGHRRTFAAVLAATLVLSLATGTAAAPDSQVPSVSITSPTGGDTVAGAVTVTAKASDNVGVVEVRWYVDSTEVASDDAAPWTRLWSSKSWSSGAHQIYAKARDAAGNWGTSAKQSITVRSIKGWPLVMSDSFDGSSVDTTKWRVYGPWIPGNGGHGVRDGSAVSVADGLLTITARMVDGTLVSGGMSNKLDQTYGFYEFLVRTDGDPGMSTSGVVLTWPQSQNWPIDGENDIFETTDDPDRDPIKSFVHYGADNKQYWFHHGARGTNWHAMAMEWDASAIRIYRDGILRWTLTDKAAIPDVAHHLSIQLDAYKNTMSGTVRLQVSWVKIYQHP